MTFYHPDYVLQVPSRQHLINLLDLAAHLRNVSLFILVLFQLRRASVKLDYKFRDGKVTKISGPWQEAIRYVLGSSSNQEYDALFSKQFHNLDQFQDESLDVFVDACVTSSSSITETDRSCRDRSKEFSFCGRSSRRRSASISRRSARHGRGARRELQLETSASPRRRRRGRASPRLVRERGSRRGGLVREPK